MLAKIPSMLAKTPFYVGSFSSMLAKIPSMLAKTPFVLGHSRPC